MDRVIAGIERRLRKRYGQPRHHNPADPLDDLIFLVLSRMTQEVKYVRTYALLRTALPTWYAVREAPREDVESLLADAGLAPTKSAQIQAILREIQNREGRLDLSRLRGQPDEKVEEYMTSLPGVARKTALCVMLYALGRDTFPVDAHVWRIGQRLGLAQRGAWTEQRSRALEARIPRRLRASLHVTLLAHGRAVCTARSPRCGQCVIADLCPSASERPTAR